jgi:hypothetical protein
MSSRDWQYDVFISYARKDKNWVVPRLKEALERSHSIADGRFPRVFFDVSPEGVPASASFMTAIAEAMSSSHWIVCAYSRAYFESTICGWELDIAMQLHYSDSGQRIAPVLVESEAARLVPLKLATINYLSTDTDDWFRRLSDSLGLRPGGEGESTTLDDPGEQAEKTSPVPPVDVKDSGGVEFEAKGSPAFFCAGKMVAVVGESLAIFNRRGKRLSTDPANGLGAWRLSAASDAGFVAAGWSGRVLAAGKEGDIAEVMPAGAGFNIPGAIAVSDELAHVGYWSGITYSVDCAKGEAKPVFRHEAGVCAIASVEGVVLVAGFDGMVALYREGRLLNVAALEPGILGMRGFRDRVLVIGRNRLYQLAVPGLAVIAEDIDGPPLDSANMSSSLPAVIDAAGRGFRVNAELVRSSHIRVSIGSHVNSVDEKGRFMATVDRDGTGTLFDDSTPVFSNPAGRIAVSRDGALLAVETLGGVRVDSRDAFLRQRGESDGG